MVASLKSPGARSGSRCALALDPTVCGQTAPAPASAPSCRNPRRPTAETFVSIAPPPGASVRDARRKLRCATTGRTLLPSSSLRKRSAGETVKRDTCREAAPRSCRLTSGERGLVERDQLAPRLFSVGLAVDRLAVRLLRHVGHAPAVLRRIDLDLGRHLCRRERLAQLVFRFGLPLVVVLGDTKVHPRLDLRRQQVRAVRIVGDEAAAVERRAGANTIRLRRGGPYDQRAAHAVSLRPDLLRLVHLRLLIEPH